MVEERQLVVQYARYMNDLFQGNWEKAWGLERGSGNIVLERLPTTFRLGRTCTGGECRLGITLGFLAAINKGTPFDRWANMVVSFGQSMPIFWLGVTLVGVAAYLPGKLPVTSGGGFTDLILPAITLAWLPAAVLAKHTRSAMLSALESDYVKLARIKGLTEWKILWKHCLRNVAVSPLISFGLIVGSFMTALVLTEAIFQWPGSALLAFQSISPVGYNSMLSGVVLCLAGGFILCHLIVDILRAFLDPRIRYSDGASPRVGAGAGY